MSSRRGHGSGPTFALASFLFTLPTAPVRSEIDFNQTDVCVATCSAGVRPQRQLAWCLTNPFNSLGSSGGGSGGGSEGTGIAASLNLTRAQFDEIAHGATRETLRRVSVHFPDPFRALGLPRLGLQANG